MDTYRSNGSHKRLATIVNYDKDMIVMKLDIQILKHYLTKQNFGPYSVFSVTVHFSYNVDCDVTSVTTGSCAASFLVLIFLKY